jgi:hypothetical protein
MSVLCAEEILVQCYGSKQAEVTFYDKAFPSGLQGYGLFYCHDATKQNRMETYYFTNMNFQKGLCR